MLSRPFVIALSLTTAVASSAFAAATACPSRPSPPAVFPRRTEETARLVPDRVKALEDYMFTLTGDDGARQGIRTDALLVIHQGAVFYEKYARGYERESPHLAWSVTKTITQLLTGIAVQNGALKIEDSICAHLKDVPADKCVLTVQNLLEFASGLDWKEDYDGSSGSRQDSSVIAMLYGEGLEDMARFVVDQPFRAPPGTAFCYSTGDATLLAAVVDNVMRPRFGEDYPWSTLFDPLGVKNMTMERDATNHHVGGAYSYAPAEDWARLGFLLLNDGCWQGARILPDGWVTAATTPSAAFINKRYDTLPVEEQGRQLWINRTIPNVRDPRPWPNVPEDAYSAIGLWGQHIAVVPSKDLVIVRSGDDRDDRALDVDKFLQLAIALVDP
jgi:CubicO group peptidase (beta-lactamase class C family)